MTYDLINVLDYNKYIDVLKPIKNNKIKVNVYTCLNDEFIDGFTIDNYTDNIDVYNQLKELYYYNDISLYVTFTTI